MGIGTLEIYLWIGAADIAICIEKVEIRVGIGIGAAEIGILVEKTVWKPSAIEPSVIHLDAVALKK
jgi:hypothetical protein